MAKKKAGKAGRAGKGGKAGKAKKYVYFFGNGKADGDRTMKDTLGGKGSGLAEMTNAGLPVPPGFTISTDACNLYYELGQKLTPAIEAEIAANAKTLEQAAGARLGDPTNPLLVSVRSGAKFSMPGMMDTVLNLGLNDRSVRGLARATDDERFAYDSYRRFIAMYARIVLDLDGEELDDQLERAKGNARAATDAEL